MQAERKADMAFEHGLRPDRLAALAYRQVRESERHLTALPIS
jgi:hypothetical protein